MTILAVDVGTTSLKMALYDADLAPGRQFQHAYPINNYDGGKADVDPQEWSAALATGCRELGGALDGVDVVTFAGTTPGLTAMGSDGRALAPAILFMDGRSRDQSRRIREAIGEQALLDATANLPVSGGCSLSSILWIKDETPDVFAKAACFGHSNTYIVKRLTGEFAMDPSSASLTCLYNTTANDLTWNGDIAAAFDLSLDRLPRLRRGYESAGNVTPHAARRFGLREGTPVLIGGNDAILAALSGDIIHPGDVSNINGTCEITSVCIDRCLASPNYNIRAHAIPGRWMTFYVMNTGGKALEWFHANFCREMPPDHFYDQYVGEAMDAYIESGARETYTPYLAGSRYSLDALTAAFEGLSVESTRERMLGAMIRGNCEYQKRNLDEVAQRVDLSDTIHVTGGGVGPALIRAKRLWMRDCEYVHQEQSSLRGAAVLGRYFLEGTYD
jgi:sugar (pentulose or hexulose) kinase